MKKACNLFTVILAVAGFGTSASAQSTVNTEVSARIIAAITLTETSPMHFGVMTAPTVLSTVILDPLGGRTTTGDVATLAQAPVAVAAAYTVTGENDATYAITVPANTIISNGNPADNMTVSNFSCTYGGFVGQVGFSGTDFFSLGATLNLAGGQAAGTYNGTFDVSVAYN